MLAKTVSDIFKMLGHTWTLSNNKVIEPTEDDLERFFDEAVKHLHTGEVGDRLTSVAGRLIVEKRDRNRYGVYVYVGEYQ